MKAKFLDLIEAVKQVQLAKNLYNTSNAEELKAVRKKFEEENPELIDAIKNWACKFKETKSKHIFKTGERTGSPIEVIEMIRIIGDRDVSECEIFERWADLATEATYVACKANNIFAEGTARSIQSAFFISDITPEDIFSEVETSNVLKKTSYFEDDGPDFDYGEDEDTLNSINLAEAEEY